MTSIEERTGVILAAGEAGRLGNKPLLPQRYLEGEHKIIMQSSIEFCWANGCKELIFVTRPDGIIWSVLWQRYAHTERGCTGMHICVQPKPNGVLDAIQRAALYARQGDLLVTFADNIYDVTEKAKHGASVREINKIHDHLYHGLDAWNMHERNSGEERSPWKQGGYPNWKHAFAGWILLPAVQFQKADTNKSIVAWFNEEGIKPYEVDKKHKWADIGTPERYEAYLGGHLT